MKKAAWIIRMRLWCHSMIFKNLLLVLMVATIGFIVAPGVSQASSVPMNASGIYSATADDGSKIFLYRYAPYTTGTPQFRSNGTPIVIFPGVIGNMNEFLSCTPPDKVKAYSTVYVPPVSSAPAWALNATGTDYEPYIKADKMRYYSLAHYLWLQGYDPWFANYRFTGRAPVRSTGTNNAAMTTLDMWATLDTPAAIAKVKAVTGKKMFIGGHSTGGFVAYAYLQGAYLDYGPINTAAAKKAYYQFCYTLGFQPHVKASASLAQARNADIKGFIGLDPSGVPPLPGLLDVDLTWTLVGSRIYLPLDAISQNLLQLLPSQQLVSLVDIMFGTINDADDLIAAAGVSPQRNLFKYLNFWSMEDTDPCMQDFTARFALSGVTLRSLGQYMDLGLNYTIREHYLNGAENYLSAKLIKGGPTPNPGSDRYYYYSQNMSRMTVPLIVFSSTEGALVTTKATYDTIISKKSPTQYDEWYVINGTAHIDLGAGGNKEPTEVFPQLGAWLDNVESLSMGPVVKTTTPASRIDR